MDICTDTCVYIQIHMYGYICKYIYEYTHIHMWIHMQIHISSFWKNIYIHLSRKAFNLSGSQPTNVLWLHCLPAYPAVGTQFWCIKHEYRHLLQKNIFPGSILPPQPPIPGYALRTENHGFRFLTGNRICFTVDQSLYCSTENKEWGHFNFKDKTRNLKGIPSWYLWSIRIKQAQFLLMIDGPF